MKLKWNELAGGTLASGRRPDRVAVRLAISVRRLLACDEWNVIELTDNPIDATALLQSAQQPEAGAVVLFLGITRQFTKGRETTSLSYEAYREMAVKELERLEQQARERWPLVDCSIVHRLGEVPLAEASVAIAVSSPHRADAFEAGRWLIDALKESVPIWKQEHWTDGGAEWVHPHGRDATLERS